MKKILLFTLFFMTILRGATAQDKTLITKNFKFNDGIYYKYTHFQQNKPDISWGDVETNLVTSKFSLQTQIEFMRLKKTQQIMRLDSIWGIVVDGIP